MRTLSAWNQSATGGLSTVMKPPGSNEAKKKFRQLAVMLRVAAE